MQTRCPFCQTLFNVTPEQLKMYAGKVRCGHCRQVFNAFETLGKTKQNAVKTPSLKDIAPRLEIQFAHSLNDDAVRLNLDADDLGADNVLEDEIDIKIDDDFAPATPVAQPIAPAPTPAAAASSFVQTPSTPKHRFAPEKQAMHAQIFEEPRSADLPKAHMFSDVARRSEPVSIAPEDLQLDIELAPSIVPEPIEMDIPESASVMPEVEPLFPEALPNQVLPQEEEVALPEINPHFDEEPFFTQDAPSEQAKQEEVLPQPQPSQDVVAAPSIEAEGAPPSQSEKMGPAGSEPIEKKSVAAPPQLAKPAEKVKAKRIFAKRPSESLMDKIKALESEFDQEEKAERQKTKQQQKKAAVESALKQARPDEKKGDETQAKTLPPPSVQEKIATPIEENKASDSTRDVKVVEQEVLAPAEKKEESTPSKEQVQETEKPEEKKQEEKKQEETEGVKARQESEEAQPSEPIEKTEKITDISLAKSRVQVEHAPFSTVYPEYFSKSDLLVNEPIFTPPKKSAATPSEPQTDAIQQNIDQIEQVLKNSETDFDALGEPASAWYAPPAFLGDQPEMPSPIVPSVDWVDFESPSPPPRSSKSILVAGLLSVLLFLQLAFFLKDEIVQRLPALRPVYQSVGLTLPLQQELKLLTIESSDLNIDNENGIFKLQATLGNRARFNQAWPNLELVLTDTFDQILIRRILRPQDYLKNPQATFFKAQSEDHIQLWLKAQNVEAVGYRLSIFYPKRKTK